MRAHDVNPTDLEAHAPADEPTVAGAPADDSMGESTTVEAIIGRLTTTWRSRASMFDRHGAIEAARAYTIVAQELEDSLREFLDQELTLTEAAAASGCSVDTIGRMIREGRVENVGRKHAPRVRRSDLLHKRRPLRDSTDSTTLVPNKAAIARAIVSTEEVDR